MHRATKYETHDGSPENCPECNKQPTDEQRKAVAEAAELLNQAMHKLAGAFGKFPTEQQADTVDGIGIIASGLVMASKAATWHR